MDRNAYEGNIVIQGVRHVYRGNTVALDGINLEIGKGLFGMLGALKRKDVQEGLGVAIELAGALSAVKK